MRTALHCIAWFCLVLVCQSVNCLVTGQLVSMYSVSSDGACLCGMQGEGRGSGKDVVLLLVAGALDASTGRFWMAVQACMVDQVWMMGRGWG